MTPTPGNGFGNLLNARANANDQEQPDAPPAPEAAPPAQREEVRRVFRASGPPPERKLTVYLPDDVYEALDAYSRIQRVNKKNATAEALTLWLSQRNYDPADYRAQLENGA